MLSTSYVLSALNPIGVHTAPSYPNFSDAIVIDFQPFHSSSQWNGRVPSRTHVSSSQFRVVPQAILTPHERISTISTAQPMVSLDTQIMQVLNNMVDTLRKVTMPPSVREPQKGEMLETHFTSEVEPSAKVEVARVGFADPITRDEVSTALHSENQNLKASERLPDSVNNLENLPSVTGEMEVDNMKRVADVDNDIPPEAEKTQPESSDASKSASQMKMEEVRKQMQIEMDRMDREFAQMDREFAQIDREFARMDQEFDQFNRDAVKIDSDAIQVNEVIDQSKREFAQQAEQPKILLDSKEDQISSEPRVDQDPVIRNLELALERIQDPNTCAWKEVSKSCAKISQTPEGKITDVNATSSITSPDQRAQNYWEDVFKRLKDAGHTEVESSKLLDIWKKVSEEMNRASALTLQASKLPNATATFMFDARFTPEKPVEGTSEVEASGSSEDVGSSREEAVSSSSAEAPKDDGHGITLTGSHVMFRS